jgi:hypothetical protein
MADIGRPREHDRDAVMKAFAQYVDLTDIPIVAEFAYLRGIDRQRLYDWPELSDTLKRCIAKKEAALERMALSGAINCTMAIFSLKQLGWTDKIDQTHKGDAANPVMITAVDSKL